MTAKKGIKTPSKGGFILFVAAAAFAVMADVTALVLVSTEIRATTAAFAVYGVAVLLTLCVGSVLLVYRRTLKALVTDRLLSGRVVAALKRYTLFDKIITDYGTRTLVTSAVVAVGNTVYVAYLVWMAVAHISPWYAALAGFYSWMLVIRSAIVLWERVFAKDCGDETAPPRIKHMIAAVSGGALIVAGGVAAAPIVQMSIGAYPHSGGISDVVINAVFAFVKMTSAVVQLMRAAGFRDPVAQALRNVSLVSAMMSLLTLQISVIIAFAHGYSMWQYVTGLGVIVSSTTIAAGVAMTAKNVVALTRRRGAAEDGKTVPAGKADEIPPVEGEEKADAAQAVEDYRGTEDGN